MSYLILGNTPKTYRQRKALTDESLSKVNANVYEIKRDFDFFASLPEKTKIELLSLNITVMINPKKVYKLNIN